MEYKVKEKIDKLDRICDKLVHNLESYLDNGIENADTQEVGMITDMIKDLCEAKKDCMKAYYYCKITDAMEESEYGYDYDEYGRRGYRGRSATTGRYVHRPYTEDMRGDMYTGNSRRYYGGEMEKSSGSHPAQIEREGKFYRAFRGYEEAADQKNRDAKIEHLNEVIESVTEEMNKIIPSMDATEKSIARNGLQSLQNRIS